MLPQLLRKYAAKHAAEHVAGTAAIKKTRGALNQASDTSGHGLCALSCVQTCSNACVASALAAAAYQLRIYFHEWSARLGMVVHVLCCCIGMT
jgi:hypothetical protein